MKKISLFVLVYMLIFQCMTVSAEYKFEYETISLEQRQQLTEHYPWFISNIAGKQYLLAYCMGSVGRQFCEYEESVSEFFNDASMGHYIKTDSGYMARSTWGDTRDNVKYWQNASSINFYDNNLNLVKKYEFESYVLDIGYYAGTYYCYLPSNNYYSGTVYRNEGKYLLSTDMENWIEFKGAIPGQNDVITYTVEDEVGLDGNELYKINYENKGNLTSAEEYYYEYVDKFGPWILKYDDNKNIYLSNDNVYFVKITRPENIKLEGGKLEGSEYLQEVGDDLVVNYCRTETEAIIQKTPKQPIYDELERMKQAPYVMYDSKILGFEEPPVIEEGRTLVPMRFLFEQMGAEVSWNADTQTAMLSRNTDTIAFSIDNDQAVVNGTPTTMEVPARLVNGKTMVPLRFLSEELGYTVDWDADTRIATIE